jgi:DNA-binding response OmpR family regulator
MKKRILIIENDISTLTEIKQCLRMNGYEIAGSAGDSVEGIQKIKDTQPDLVILDYQLENGTKGTEVARFIKETKPIPIVYLVEFRNSEIIDDIATTQYDVYLPKPFTMSTLILNIGNIFRRLADVPPPQFVQFLSLSETIHLPVDNVLWIESIGNENGIRLTTVHEAQKYRIYQSLDAFLTINALPCLQRISRNCILNLSYVTHIKRGQTFIVPKLFEPIIKEKERAFAEFPLGKTYRNQADRLLECWKTCKKP